MKSKFALTLVIATGMLMGTTGATMAISGSSGSGSAAENQYCVPGESGGSVAGDDSSGSGDEACDNGTVVLSASDEGVPPVEEQVATASTDSLPFTGFAAIPLLILGLGFVSVGLLVRYKANRVS